MKDFDAEDSYESDSSGNEENHSQLLQSVSQLDSTQRVKPAQRKEIATEVSEYNLNKGLSANKNLINVNELIQVLGNKSRHAVISKKVKKVTGKSKTLRKPLEKPTEERLKRSVGFEKVKEQLGRWDAIVERNALRDNITFPLNDSPVQMQKSTEFLSQFKTSTPLEQEMAKILKQEKPKEEDAEEQDFPLTLEEMMEKRKEMAQLRARLSYKQRKAQHQSKIKSKKYHRLLKREKLRQQLKEFEILQKTDPEAALKKLSELDKTRAQERASLRHRNTGQWAKNLTVRAKYDINTRKILAEQLKMSRELTQKVSVLDTSDNEDPEESVPVETVHQNSTSTTNTTDITQHSTGNPWTLDVSKEVQEFVSGYKKFWNEQGNEIKNNEPDKSINKSDKDSFKKISVIQNEEMFENNNSEVQSHQLKSLPSADNLAQSEKPIKGKFPMKSNASPNKHKTCVSIHPTSGVWLVAPVTEESDSEIKKNKKTEDIDSLFDGLSDKLMKRANKRIKTIKNKMKKSERAKVQIEKPKKEFDLSLKSSKTIERPDLDVGLLEGVDENEIQENGHVNATSSNEHKVAPTIDPKNFIQVTPKRLRTHLPENITGGEDELDDEKAQQLMIEEAFGDDDVMAEFNQMKEEEEKNSKIEIETSLPGWGVWGGTGIVPNPRKKRRLIINLPPRKDKLKKDVIMNENENPNLKNHLVKEVPHPFKSVDAFEANIRAPVGRDWVPETAHQKLIQKPIVTKLGAIIEPMNEDNIVRLKKKSLKSPYQGKKKKKKNLN